MFMDIVTGAACVTSMPCGYKLDQAMGMGRRRCLIRFDRSVRVREWVETYVLGASHRLGRQLVGVGGVGNPFLFVDSVC